MSDAFNPYHRWLGIPPKHQPPDHYRLLGLELFESDPEVIEDAAERQIGHVRKHQLGEHRELSQRILNELGEARACLLSPQRKADYDHRLRYALAQKKPAAPAAPIAAPLPTAAPTIVVGEKPAHVGGASSLQQLRSRYGDGLVFGAAGGLATLAALGLLAVGLWLVGGGSEAETPSLAQQDTAALQAALATNEKAPASGSLAEGALADATAAESLGAIDPESAPDVLEEGDEEELMESDLRTVFAQRAAALPQREASEQPVEAASAAAALPAAEDAVPEEDAAALPDASVSAPSASATAPAVAAFPTSPTRQPFRGARSQPSRSISRSAPSNSLPSFRIALPSGETFDSGQLVSISETALDARALERLKLTEVPAGGAIIARTALDPKSYKPTGLAYYLQPSGVAKMVVSYDDGNRSGPMIVYDALGQWLFFGVFTRNNRDGFFCVFEKGEPSFLQRFEKDRLQDTWRIVQGSPQERSEGDSDYAEGQARLEEILETAKRDELDLFKTIRDIVDETRRDLAARRAVQSRANNINKANEHRQRGVQGIRQQRSILP